jgi:4-carboxymuconolactone decarboxylase
MTLREQGKAITRALMGPERSERLADAAGSHTFGADIAGYALDHGMPLQEIEEALIQMLPYVGFPAISSILTIATKIIAERGLDKTADYAGHRGLL